MKYIAILLIFFSVNAHAGIFWWDGKESKTEETKKVEEKICHLSLWVVGKDEGQRVFYIYRVPCGVYSQVGIVDENENKIYTIKNLKKTSSFEYYGNGAKSQYIDEKFPNVKSLEIFKK